jgi:hypothetical protein
MNVLAGGREISGFYTEYWSIVEDPVFNGRRKGFQNCSSGGREKAVFSVSLQPTLLSTPPEVCSFQCPLEGYPPAPSLQIFNGLQHNIKKLLNVFLIKAGKRYPEIGFSEGNKAYAVCVKKMHPE